MSDTNDYLSTLRATPLFEAPVVEVREEGANAARVVVELGAHPLVQSYTSIGQYVAMGPQGDPRYFVIASAPGGATAEFLIGAGSEVSDWIIQRNAGGSVYMSAAMGAGFDARCLSVESLVLLATGTGVAALRPLMERRVALGLAQGTRLYLGLEPNHKVPFLDELERWSRLGAYCSWSGAGRPTRFVQEMWADDPGESFSAQTHVAICGGPAMFAAATAFADSLGIQRDHIHTNY